MERLLKDASKISGIKYDISSYADVVAAIHEVQTAMGITGTTALEAEETISGSISAMKAAATNLITGFGNANADIGKLTSELIGSVKTVIDNLLPVISQIAKSIPEAIGAILPAFGEMLPELLAAIPPLFEQVLNALMDILPGLIPVAVDALFIIVNTITENLPMVIDIAVDLINALIDGLKGESGEIGRAALDIIVALVDGLLELIPTILDVAADLIVGLAMGIADNVDVITGKATDIIITLVVGLVKNLPKIIIAGTQLVWALIDGIGQMGAKLLIKTIQLGKDVVSGIIKGIKAKATELWSAVKGIADGIISKFKKELDSHSPSRRARDQVGKPITQGIAEGITSEQQKLNKAISDLSDEAMDTALEEAKDFKDIGKKYAELMGKGIEENTETSTLAVTKLVNDSIATLIGKNKKAKGEYQKAGKEVISAYTTAIKDGVKEVQEQITAEVQRITEEAQAQYDEIIKKKEDMESKLAGFGELFTIDQESGEAVINNLNNQIDAIQRYDDVLSNLKSKGVSDEFMSEITKLGIGEGTKFGESLLKLSDEQFRAYEANWVEKQKLAKEVAAKFYKDQLDTLQSDMVNRLDATLKSVPNIVKNVGVNAMQGMIDGMDSRKGAAVGKAKEIADAIISELQRAMQINSPSRLTRDLIGKNIVRGIEVGIDDEKQSLLNKMKWVVDTSKNEMGLLMANKTQGAGTTSVVTNNNDNGVNQTVIVNSPVKSPLEMMREAKRAAKEMAYA